MRYYITSSQTSVHPDDEGFATKAEAWTALREEVAVDLARARAKWGKAHKAVFENGVEIRATRDPQSTLWRRYTIISF